MRNLKGIEYYQSIWDLHQSQLPLAQLYSGWRTQLESMARELTRTNAIPFTRLVDRLLFLKQNHAWPLDEYRQLTAFRLRANRVIQHAYTPTSDEYWTDFNCLCQFIAYFFQVEIPDQLRQVIPDNLSLNSSKGRVGHTKCLRVHVEEIKWPLVYVSDQENEREQWLAIDAESVQHQAFQVSLRYAWIGAALHVIDAQIDEDHTLTAQLFILEPDYLMDISALAEQFQEYGVHPYSYFKSKLEPKSTSTPILLGNMANLFLDELVHEKPGQAVTFEKLAQKAFRESPLEYALFDDLTPFFEQARLQFENIQRSIRESFPLLHIDCEKALLEPSFICAELGLQGRLDFLQLDTQNNQHVVIELKSGKAAFPENNPALIKPNHETQTSLYQYVIQRMLGIPHEELQTFVFYSKYTDARYNLRPAKSNMARIKEALNLRNILVALERNIAFEPQFEQMQRILHDLSPEKLYTLSPRQSPFIDQYIRPQFDAFRNVWQRATALELKYFFHQWQFTALEHWLAKLQIRQLDEMREGAYWTDFAGKKANGEILYDLQLAEKDNHCDEEGQPLLTFSLPDYEADFLPNFRQGDVVILYQRNTEKDFATTQQVFKGSIQNLSADSVTVRLKYRQRHRSIFPSSSKYALEHDAMDTTFQANYRALFTFLQADPARRALLLNQRQPQIDTRITRSGNYLNAQIDELVLQAKQAQDYYLLVGPPGTGKTSVALKAMVDEFYADSACSILLLSYTNRAVDEICEALDELPGQPNYIRIGSEYACEAKFKPRLLKNTVAPFTQRAQVKNCLQSCRIYVGTVATFSARTDLFQFKRFDVAIIDEASQILEGNLIGLLSEKVQLGEGKWTNAIGKFILIGDPKQLPAVVVQSEACSQVQDQQLREAGLIDRRQSLFERLYRLQAAQPNNPICGFLHRHGRMHPEIAAFPNHLFYNSRLQAVPTAHQAAELEFVQFDAEHAVDQIISQKRLAFFAAEPTDSAKTNANEAQIVRLLVQRIYHLYQLNQLPFKADESVGIITPYRSQIALIRRELQALHLPELMDITVDTVERYQGSQRDIILYSFAVNSQQQLDFVANTVESEGVEVDRKLNVALTRAKKQLFVMGCDAIIGTNPLYRRLINHIRSKGGFVKATIAQLENGNIPSAQLPLLTYETLEKDKVCNPKFEAAFQRLVSQPLREDVRTLNPTDLLGIPDEFHRLYAEDYPLANALFTASSLTDCARLYAFYQMRAHYATSSNLFEIYAPLFAQELLPTHGNGVFIDLGCGTFAGSLAWATVLQQAAIVHHLKYIGVEKNEGLRQLATQFAIHCGVEPAEILSPDAASDTLEHLQLDSKPQTYIWHLGPQLKSFTDEEIASWAAILNQVAHQSPLNRTLLVVQHPCHSLAHRPSQLLLRLLRDFQLIVSPHTQHVITALDSASAPVHCVSTQVAIHRKSAAIHPHTPNPTNPTNEKKFD